MKRIFFLNIADVMVDVIILLALFAIENEVKEESEDDEDLSVCLVGFLMSSSETTLYRGGIKRQSSNNFTCCHTRDRVGRS